MKEESPPGGPEPVATSTYRHALQMLKDQGYARIEKALYAETLDEQLARLKGQAEAAALQEVRLVRHPDRVEIFRVHRAGEKEYVDETPQAVVRRPSAE